jgi:hypothetical protein
MLAGLQSQLKRKNITLIFFVMLFCGYLTTAFESLASRYEIKIFQFILPPRSCSTFVLVKFYQTILQLTMNCPFLVWLSWCPWTKNWQRSLLLQHNEAKDIANISKCYVLNLSLTKVNIPYSGHLPDHTIFNSHDFEQLRKLRFTNRVETVTSPVPGRQVPQITFNDFLNLWRNSGQ